MNRRYHHLTFAALALALGSGGTLIVQQVRAAGVPKTGALTYAGVLALPDGTSVQGTKNIGLAVYDAASNGNLLCQVMSAPVPVQGGHFQVALPDVCLVAVQSNSDVWVDVQVDGGSVGRSKLGAVPYAIEAQRAAGASSVVGGGALDQRLAALEGQVSGKVAGMWFVSPTSDCVSITNSPEWKDISGMNKTFSVTKPVTLWATYSFNVQPDGEPGAEWIGTHLVIDNIVAPVSGGHYQPYSGGDSNVNIVGNYVGDLAAGEHTVKLQWFTQGTTRTWSNCPWPYGTPASAVGSRSIVIMAIYK